MASEREGGDVNIENLKKVRDEILKEDEEMKLLRLLLNKIYKMRMTTLPDLEIALENYDKEYRYIQEDLEGLIKSKKE